jgi:hypothetical protein
VVPRNGGDVIQLRARIIMRNFHDRSIPGAHEPNEPPTFWAISYCIWQSAIQYHHRRPSFASIQLRMEHPLPKSYDPHPILGPWSPYQGHVVNYATGDLDLMGSKVAVIRCAYAILALSSGPYATPHSTNDMNISISKLM